MATSNSPSTTYTSSQYVESAGAILFHLSKKAVCLVRLIETDEWLLPKGRRACEEPRHKAALREAEEETGYKANLLPLTIPSRATPKIEYGQTTDQIRTYEKVIEPFAMTIRRLGSADIKLIWWYAAVIDEDALVGAGEAIFEVDFFDFEDAIKRLTFLDDQKTLQLAVDLMKSTYISTDV